jgi:hypothetical protein
MPRRRLPHESDRKDALFPGILRQKAIFWKHLNSIPHKRQMTRIGHSLHPRGRTPFISYKAPAETNEISTASDLKQRQRVFPSRHMSLALCSSHRPARAFQICETHRCHPTVASSFRDRAATPQQPRSNSEQEHVTGLRRW